MRHSDDACCGAGISLEAVRCGVEARLGDGLPKSAGSRGSRVCRGGHSVRMQSAVKGIWSPNTVSRVESSRLDEWLAMFL